DPLGAVGGADCHAIAGTHLVTGCEGSGDGGGLALDAAKRDASSVTEHVAIGVPPRGTTHEHLPQGTRTVGEDLHRLAAYVCRHDLEWLAGRDQRRRGSLESRQLGIPPKG